MAKDKPGECLVCHRPYAYLWDHIKKNHLHSHIPLPTLAAMGYTACPACGQACQSTHGIFSHQARTCNKAPRRSLTPTLPETPNHTAPTSTATALTAYPATTIQAGSRRKRRRNSPSPPPARDRAKPRARNTYTHNNHSKISTDASREVASLLAGSQKEYLQQGSPELGSQDGQVPDSRSSSIYGSPNDSTIGHIENLLSSPGGGQSGDLSIQIPDHQPADNSSRVSSPAESDTAVANSPSRDTGRQRSLSQETVTTSEYQPSPTASPVSLGPQLPGIRTYGDEHTPPPPDLADTNRGKGQDKSCNFQPRNKYLQQLFSYNHIQAKDHTFRGTQASHFADAAARCATRYSRQASERHLLDFLLLPKVGLTLGVQSEEFSVRHTLQQYPDFKLPPPTQIEAEEAQEHLGQPHNLRDTPTRRAQRLVERGYLGRAARALVDPTSLARNSSEVLAKLKEKHPAGQQRPFASNASPRAGPRPTAEDIHQALATFPKDTAAGLSGWSVPLLQEACKRKQVVEFLVQLCKQIQNGTAPGSQLLTASRLVALDKEDGGVRPIAVGELIYRLVAKVLLRKQFVVDQLAPFQLGVQSPGGVEPIIHLLRHAVDGNLRGYTHVCSADFQNAFNSVSRKAVSAATIMYAPEFYKPAKWAYDEPSALVMYDGTVITSSEGVRQGDPLGPLLFSLAIRHSLEQLQQQLRSATRKGLPPPIIVAYLDDVYILSGQEIRPEKLADYLQHAPITLNIQKTKSYPLAELRQTGLKALGSFVGPLDGRKRFLQDKIEELQQVLERLQDLPKQHALLLLRASTSSLLRHLPRTIEPEGLQDELQDIDRRLLQTVKHLQGSYDDKPLDQDLVALPARLGGLGITLFAETAHLAFQNSKAIADLALQKILTPKLFWRLPREFSPSPTRSASGDDLQQDQDDLQQDQDNPQQDQDNLQQDSDDDSQQDQAELQQPRGRSKTRATETQQQSLAYFLTQNVQEEPEPTPRHQSTNALGTGLARSIYRTAMDKLHKARLARVQQKLSQGQEAVRMENSSYLGRRWLSALPTSQPLLLADMDIAAALSIRLLTTPEDEQDICRHCNRAYTFGHEDACRARTRQTIAKHDKICQALATALQTCPDNKVFLEPQGDYRGTRTDIRIDNPRGSVFLDVSVISLTKESAKKDPYDTLAAAEQAKKNKYRNLGQAFKPFILSQGGLLGKETSQTYKELQQSFSPSIAEWLDKYISTLLVRLRARNWMGYGIN
ncbi:hypothetical protein KCU64_g16723, partial [Aureobasidium melanogenum]